MDLSQIIVPPDFVELNPIVTCTIEGILTEEDLRELALGGLAPDAAPGELTVTPDDDNPNDLKKIREKHHSVARMMASGMTQRMVAACCGFTEQYLSILLNNPSMKELVELYRIKHGAATEVITEKLKTVGLKAVERLEEKLEAGELSNQELLGAAKLGLDRGGHGPASKQHHLVENHLIDHAAIVEMNNEARRRSANLIVDVKEVRQAVLPAPEKENDNG